MHKSLEVPMSQFILRICDLQLFQVIKELLKSLGQLRIFT